jgi:hypothetical protein
MSDQHPTPSLADDILNGVGEISRYCGQPERRVRHLIADHGMPAIRLGRIIHSRRSWLDAYFAGAEQPTETGGGR